MSADCQHTVVSIRPPAFILRYFTTCSARVALVHAIVDRADGGSYARLGGKLVDVCVIEVLKLLMSRPSGDSKAATEFLSAKYWMQVQSLRKFCEG